MLAEIGKGKAPDLAATLAVIATARPDILLLTDIDWDYRGDTLAALAGALGTMGLEYRYRFAARPNTGMDTGLDIDGNGTLAEPRDAQGYGAFTGQHGMAVLSRFPIATGQVRDFSTFLWKDLPEGQGGEAKLSPAALDVLRLPSTAHWDLPVETPAGPLHLWAFAATTPLFDGPEDRNGRRNHDEAAFWLHYLNGKLPQQPSPAPFVILGNANLDPDHGAGRPEALRRLLADPRLQDPKPGAATAPRQNPLATADFGAKVGPLRLDYILPSAQLTVTGAGVIWSEAAARASKHRLVWVDIAQR